MSIERTFDVVELGLGQRQVLDVGVRFQNAHRQLFQAPKKTKPSLATHSNSEQIKREETRLQQRV